MVWRLLILLSIAAYAVAENATRCLECTDMPHPADCTTVTSCAQGQTCVVEQFITSAGLVLFNSGCQSRMRCKAGGRRDIPQYSSLSKRSDIITCDQCCEGDFCNNQGCGNIAPKQPQRGALCFQCNVEDDPRACRHLGNCDIGNVCMLTELQERAPDGSNLYHSACVIPMVCRAYALIGKRRNTYCHVCCDDDFCNDRCEALVTPAPTTPTTTTSTTTTTTTPTPTTTSTTPTTTTTTPTTTTTTPTTTTPTTTTTTKRPTTTHRPLTPHDICVHHNYHYDPNSQLCYQFHYERKNWEDANGVCKSNGGTLAIIDTQVKWNFLRNAIKQDSKYRQEQRLFVGGKYTGHKKDFIWADGTRVGFADWEHGEPDGQKNECIYLNRDDSYRWHDTPCSNLHMFICTIKTG